MGTELVFKEAVSVMKASLIMEIFALTFVKVSIVEPEVTVHKEFVVVMPALPT